MAMTFFKMMGITIKAFKLYLVNINREKEGCRFFL